MCATHIVGYVARKNDPFNSVGSKYSERIWFVSQCSHYRDVYIKSEMGQPIDIQMGEVVQQKNQQKGEGEEIGEINSIASPVISHPARLLRSTVILMPHSFRLFLHFSSSN